MTRLRRWLPVAGLVLPAGAFAWLNRGETVTLRFGLFTLRGIPAAAAVLGAIILGMVAMFVYGLRQDLLVRRLLRAHGLTGRLPAAPPERSPVRERERVHAGYDDDAPDL